MKFEAERGNEHQNKPSASAESLNEGKNTLSAQADKCKKVSDLLSASAETLNERSDRLSAIADRLKKVSDPLSAENDKENRQQWRVGVFANAQNDRSLTIKTINMTFPLREDIKELNENLTAFPEAESIFVKEQAWLKEHLLPLISIDLGELNSQWQGTKVHLLNPIEPYGGYIGEQTSEYHNEFTTENWLAFRLNEQNQYEFLGNEGYFLRSPLHEQNWDKEAQEHFNEIVEIYNESKAQVAKDGYLIFPRSKPFKGKPNITNFLDRLGGGTWYGNWTEGVEISSAFEMKLPPVGTTYDEMEQMLNSGIEISYKGNPFYFIANAAGYNYCGHGADAIILLYEPVSRIVLFTFDWT